MLLALDVGFRATGWVVFNKGKIVETGCILTEKAKAKTVRMSNDNADRAARIALELQSICSEYKVKGIIGELPSGGAQSAKAMQQMALATGVVAATASILNLPVEWTDPNSVKLAVCGIRSASKDEIMEAIRKKFDYPFAKQKNLFEHIADAIGVYLALKTGNLVKLYG